MRESMKSECIAYALACGLPLINDQDGEKERRRARHARRAQGKARSERRERGAW